MFNSYFKVAIRNFLKQRSFALINIIGLAIGLASVLLIFLYIDDELSYDNMHPQAENVYRIGYTGLRQDGTEFQATGIPGGWPLQLKQQLPEVEEHLRILWTGYPVSVVDKEKDKILLTEQMYWVEPSYNEMLLFNTIRGDTENPFAAPNSMAISAKIARQFFGNENPIDRFLVFKHPWMTDGEEIEVKVSAVFEDYPSNVHFKPDYLVNYNVLNPVFDGQFESFSSDWQRGWFNTYIRTSPGADINHLARQLKKMLGENIGEEAENYQPVFQNVSGIHFDTVMPWTTEGPGDISYIFIFGSVAILILLVACINYMNLATARSAKRSREIGMRKSFGSSRQQLMFQFFIESLITTLLALLLALGLVALLLPVFNELAFKSFTIGAIFSIKIAVAFFIIILLVSLIAGSYPAVYLSGFSPIKALKSKLVTGKGSEIFRKLLVIVQFCISLILIVGTIVVVRQMNYIGDSKLNQQGDQILSIRYGGTAPADRYQTFKNSVLEEADFQQVTMGNHLPRQNFFGGIDATFNFPDISPEPYNWSQLNVDFDFAKTFNLEFEAGRDFNMDNLADSNAFIINMAALKNLNIDLNKAIGLTVSVAIGEDQTIDGQVIGVVKDFPYRSMHETIGPLVISARPHSIDKIVYVKLPVSKINDHIATLEKKWKSIFPGIGFDYWFISDEFGRMYQAEERMADLIRNFSILAIIIACMGLFGLASYLAERRTKEIGIRKVMGASAAQMVFLLFSNFVKLLMLASLIALPLAYYLMHDWLQNFIYHINLSWWIFLLALLLVGTLTIVTVGYESLKASFSNPVDAIRHD